MGVRIEYLFEKLYGRERKREIEKEKVTLTLATSTIRCRSFPYRNTLAYSQSINDEKNIYIRLATIRASVMKLFTAVSYAFS